MKVALEQVFDGSLPLATPSSGYDPDKLNLGDGTGQFIQDGMKFAGPVPPPTAFLTESGAAIPAQFIQMVQSDSDDVYWVFGLDNAARRVSQWVWKVSTNTITFKGSIQITMPTTGTHTFRGFRVVFRSQGAGGTVAVSGTTVTGSGTTFTTGFSAGSWIYFGPKGVAPIYYEIASINSATSITLLNPVPTAIPAGTACTIVDMMILTTTTNTTTTNGGLFVTKGLNPDLFIHTTFVTAAGGSIDKVRGTFSLKDAATNTQVAAVGCADENVAANTMVSQFVYVGEGAASSLKLYKYNFRAPLTLTAGVAQLTSPNVVVTGAQTVTGTILQSANGKTAKVSHGPGSGVDCLYLGTSTRICRIPLASITPASTTFVADSMAETVPGNSNTCLSVGTFTAFDYCDMLDRFIIFGAIGTGTMYCTQYNTAGAAFERRFGSLTNQLSSNQRDEDQPAYPHFTGGNVLFGTVTDKYLVMLIPTTTVNLNQLYIYPIGVDNFYTLTSRIPDIILPKILLADYLRLYRVVVNAAPLVGSDLLGVPTEAYKIKYRTDSFEILSNGTTWTDLDATGNLANVTGASQIQFALEFKTMGVVLMPARIFSVTLLAEQGTAWLPDCYAWNPVDFDTNNGTFAWKQTKLSQRIAQGASITYFRKDTGAILFTQASNNTTNGVFQFWTGSTWINGTGSASYNVVGTRRRFVPTFSLPVGVGLYVLLIEG